MFMYLFFSGLSTSMPRFSYLYTDFLDFFFLINSNHFLIKSHKPDLFSLINKLARNFRKKIHVHRASDVFARFALKALYVFSE